VYQLGETKSESVNDYCFAAGKNLTASYTANSCIDSKNALCSTNIPNTLPLIQAQLKNLRYKIVGWKFHSTGAQRKSCFSRSIGSFVELDTDMTCYPEHSSCFHTPGVVHGNFLHKV